MVFNFIYIFELIWVEKFVYVYILTQLFEEQVGVIEIAVQRVRFWEVVILSLDADGLRDDG